VYEEPSLLDLAVRADETWCFQLDHQTINKTLAKLSKAKQILISKEKNNKQKQSDVGHILRQ
jgi:hypothetical protein